MPLWLNGIVITTYRVQQIYSIPSLRHDLLCDRMEYVPTCLVFTGPLTINVRQMTALEDSFLILGNEHFNPK